MNEANVSLGNVNGLGDDLRIAQESINLPEVQEMLRRLSRFNLGICMPHMHDEETGGFQNLPQELVQVEAGLEVSFSPGRRSSKPAGLLRPCGMVLARWGDCGGRVLLVLRAARATRKSRPETSARVVVVKLGGAPGPGFIESNSMNAGYVTVEDFHVAES